MRERGLRDVRGDGCLREAAMISHGDDVFELSKIHSYLPLKK